jgi:hypothetical protein
MGLASTHFMNLSTATRRCVNPEGAVFTIGIAFYFEMRRRMSTMGMLSIFTMNDAWLRLAAQAFP